MHNYNQSVIFKGSRSIEKLFIQLLLIFLNIFLINNYNFFIVLKILINNPNYYFKTL